MLPRGPGHNGVQTADATDAIDQQDRPEEAKGAAAAPRPRPPGRPRGGPRAGAALCALVEEQPCFRNATLVIIVLNALWIAVDVEWNHSRLRSDGRLPLEPVSTVVENLFCAYFFIELAIRFLAFDRKVRCLWDKWFVFDATLVLFMVLETWVLPLVDAIAGNEGNGGALSRLSSFRLLRLLRLTRMVKIMRFFPELLTLIRSIVDATQAVFFILLFLVIVVYVFAIVFTSQVGSPAGAAGGGEDGGEDGGDPGARDMFGDIGSSMMTLFTNGVLGDNLAETLMAIKDESLLLMWLFVIFVLISGVTLLNMLIGVVCQVVDESAKKEAKARQFAELRQTLTQAFHSADTSKDGQVGSEEWDHIKESSLLRYSLARLGVEEDEIDNSISKMHQSLFESADRCDKPPRSLGFDEFVEKILEMRSDTPAKTLDVEMLKAAITLEDNALKKRLDHIEANLMRLVATGAPPSCETGHESSVGALHAEPCGQDACRSEQPGWLEEVPTELLFQALKTRD